MNVEFAEVLVIIIAILGAFSVPILLALVFMRGQRKPLKPKPEDLIEAEQLLGQGSYALSIIKAFIALEVCLKFRLNEKELKFKELVHTARKRRVINRDGEEKSIELLALRQELIHEGNLAPAEKDAKSYLENATDVISSLGFATD